MDFETIKDKTMAALSNPRIITFTLIGTTTMLIGAFLFFGDDSEEPVTASAPEAAAAAAAVAAPFSFINEPDTNEIMQEPEQTGGKAKRKKTRRAKKQHKHVSLKNRH